MQSESHCKITRQNHRLQLLVRIERRSHERVSWGWEVQDRIAGQKSQGRINVWHREAELWGRITGQNCWSELQGRVTKESHGGGKCRTELRGKNHRVELICGIVRQNCRAESQVRIAGQNCKAESRKRVMGVESVGQNCWGRITGQN